jgi:hypothetical protein
LSVNAVTLLVVLLLVAVALPFAIYAILYWLLAEANEEEQARKPKARIVRYWDAMIWNAVGRWWDPPRQLSYRRDKRGRFRKMR